MPPFGKVFPHLYVGAKPPPDHKLGLAFDWIVLCAYEVQRRTGEFGRAHVMHVPMDDTDRKPPTAHEVAIAVDGGRNVAKLLAEGKDVLVTCQKGRNRSAWVSAIAMIESGVPGEKAIQQIRSVRGPRALSNEGFVRHILSYRPQTTRASRRVA
jgi:protein-tyrosine phosphatase